MEQASLTTEATECLLFLVCFEQQAQFQCSVEWLAGRASASGDSGLHQTTLGPLYHPFTSCGKVKKNLSALT